MSAALSSFRSTLNSLLRVSHAGAGGAASKASGAIIIGVTECANLSGPYPSLVYLLVYLHVPSVSSQLRRYTLIDLKIHQKIHRMEDTLEDTHWPLALPFNYGSTLLATLVCPLPIVLLITSALGRN